MGSGSFFAHFVLVLHIAGVVGTFGTLMTMPALLRKVQTFAAAKTSANGSTNTSSNVAAELLSAVARVTKHVSLPALGLVFVTGLILVSTNTKAFRFDAPWVSGGFLIVLVVAALLIFLLDPTLTKMRDAIASASSAEVINKARARVAMSTGLIHLSMVIGLVLMVWKPGQ